MSPSCLQHLQWGPWHSKQPGKGEWVLPTSPGVAPVLPQLPLLRFCGLGPQGSVTCSLFPPQSPFLL